jgi:hypothetical protein
MGGAILPQLPSFHIPSPRTLPVNIPFSNIGITIVTLDGHGNVTIKVDQPFPEAGQP